jgi:hypothetical protein
MALENVGAIDAMTLKDAYTSYMLAEINPVLPR